MLAKGSDILRPRPIASSPLDIIDQEAEAEGEGEGEAEGEDDKKEGEEGEEMQVGEGGDDEDYEREVPSPSDIDDCDWSGLSCRIHDIPDKCLSPLLSHSVHPESVTLVFL